jgi:glyoxylase-like metal-dependent hydrolase (beta-lactamase superfamily II)
MKNRLQQIGTHTWIFPLESAKDRPNLGYVLGKETALAIDAGHSSSHVEDFYRALEAEGLPLPDLTVITHWHWDHTFGMHAVHGKTLARPETNQKLLEIQKKMADNPGYGKKFLRSDPCIIREYAGGVPLVVVPADEELTGDRTLDLGDVAVELHYAESPHTDDALLVYVPDDKVLFVGDAQLGEFPTWFMNPDKSAALKRQVMSYDVRTVIDGHWRSYTKAEYLEELY